MRCKYCGSRIKVDDNCRKCGAPTPEINSPVYHHVEYIDATGTAIDWGVPNKYNLQSHIDVPIRSKNASSTKGKKNMKPTIWEKLFWPVVFLLAAGVLYGWFQFLMQYPGG